jgi:sulfatase maturation enzyme AslB (radical SAM superfamily)
MDPDENLDIRLCGDFLDLLHDYVVERKCLSSSSEIERFFVFGSEFSSRLKRKVFGLLKNSTLNLFRVIDCVCFELLFEHERLLLLGNSKSRAESILGLVERHVDYRASILRELRSRYSESKSRKQKKIINGISGRLFEGISRLVVLVTHRCQLRCSYCRVRKYDAQMHLSDIIRSADLLLGSRKKRLQLQFFGGEPLLRFDEIKKVVEYAEKKAEDLGKELSFLLTTNGIALTSEKLDFFRRHDFTIELSLDGSAEAQSAQRKSPDPKKHYEMIVRNLDALFSSGVRHYAIMVVTPESVHDMIRNFQTLAGYGFSQIQVNYALGRIWDDEKWKAFLEGMQKIARHYSGNEESFLNFTERLEPVVLNAEVTVDCDGTIFLETGICIEEDFAKIKEAFKIGELSSSKNVNLLSSTHFLTFYRLSRAYSQKETVFREIIINNIIRGEQLGDFLMIQRRGKK